jgi:acyl-CoA reductase-like NAD-dependent aldehyde dehydrogenase
LTVLQAALAHSNVCWIRAAGPQEGLRALCERAPPHLLERGSLWPLRNRTLPLAEANVPAEAAARVLEQAVGRAATLSGQFPGQVARVVCPERALSRFTGALLEALAAHAEAERPLAPLDADLGDHVGSAWALGLDEGATPIHGTEPSRSGPQPVVVFTNVDPDLSLAQLSRPAPVLALIRAKSDEHARALALALDRPVPLIACEEVPR